MSVDSANVLIIVNNWGIEEQELTRPLRELAADGARVTLAATTLDPCETVLHDRYPGETVTPDALLADVRVEDYDLLVVPGGTCNVDRLRVNPDAPRLAKDFADAGKPVAVVCHGPWLLVDAGPLPGKTLTSCRYIKADIVNSGGCHVDEPVHACESCGWTLITSRKSDDLDNFIDAIRRTL